MIKKMFPVMLFSLLVAPAFAQSDATRGEGTFRLDRDKSEIAKATFYEKDDSRFECMIELRDKTTLTFGGSYSGDDRKRVLRIHHGFAQKHEINGNGEIMLHANRGGIDSLEASGDLNDGSSFRVSFNGKGHSERPGDFYEGEHVDKHSFSDHVRGTGRLDYGDEKHRITNLDINMSRNGDLTLRVNGPDGEQEEWTGSWYGDGPVYDVTLTRQGGKRVDFRGQVTLASGKRYFKKLELSGQRHGNEFRLYFESK